MSTNDVPGASPQNGDTLKAGCWAEHDDGSLVLVISTEGGTVAFLMWDVEHEPIAFYLHSLPEREFKRSFSAAPTGSSQVKWTWHDKTPFPIERVHKTGAAPRPHFSAGAVMSAARRVAESLRLHASRLDETQAERMARRATGADDDGPRGGESAVERARELFEDFLEAMRELRP